MLVTILEHTVGSYYSRRDFLLNALLLNALSYFLTIRSPCQPQACSVPYITDLQRLCSLSDLSLSRSEILRIISQSVFVVA